MIKKSISRQLVITFTTIIGIIVVLVGLMVTGLMNFEKNENIESIVNKQISIVEKGIVSYLSQEEHSYEQLDKILKMMSLSTNMDGVLVDNLGYIYMVSNDKYSEFKYTKINENNINGIKNLNEVKEEKKIYKMGLLKTYVKPISIESNTEGYIIMTSNTNSNIHSNIIISVWVLILSAIALSGFIVNYFSNKIILKPLNNLNKTAQKIVKGEVEKRIEVDRDDEIGELAQSFNSMAEALSTVDKTRREFISNVSHELRSPITSIKGFINGILDGVIPKDRENYYLNIVFDEINRLARLVNDLLDLSSMESGKFKLNLAEFDINNVVSLCIMNSEEKIRNKGLDVKAVFDDKRFFVIGDRDRIIQVVTNLLENAIKYGDDNGKIKIQTYSKGEKVYVSIFNTGETIPKEDLNNIWERFYKSDKARTNKISTGLGLPVVRLILSQHNEDIWVKNIDNMGVEFTFSMIKSNK